VRCSTSHAPDTADGQRDAPIKAQIAAELQELVQATKRRAEHSKESMGVSTAREAAVQMPLLDAVRDRGKATQEAAFHIPGHKRGAGASEAMLELMGGRTAFQHDLTELPGGY
jgi:hypothetical protein